jgi:PKD repeat protein
VFARAGATGVVGFSAYEKCIAGDWTSAVRIVVGNDRPVIGLTLPTVIDEETSASFLATATDSDGEPDISWDFGDDSVPVSGAEVSHLYADPGSYTVTVTATDSQGAESTVTQTVTVNDIDQAPSLAGVPRQVVVEGRAWTLQPIAFDPDPHTDLTFTLENAPAGMSIDPDSGEINWTPEHDQGPASYHFAVVASDQSGLSGQSPIAIDVVDTGSIGGSVFSDVDGNGVLDVVNEAVAGATVRLDVGDDGTFDQLTLTDAEGAFRFDLSPIGLYRVVAELPAGWESTTPTEILVDMPVSESVEIAPIGGREDSDGDGVSNLQELTSVPGPDANGDGVDDWRQAHVVSQASPFAGVVTVAAPIGTTVRDVTFTTPPVDPPAGTSFPFGAIRFSLNGLASGAAADVELMLHGSPAIHSVFKFGLEAPGDVDMLYQVMGAVAGEDRIQLRLQDGSASDMDDSAGRITQQILPGTSSLTWQNPTDPFDVDNNGLVTALDALLVINRLGLGLGNLLPPTNDTDRFFDVTGDGRATALDALRVINQIARRQVLGSGEQIDWVQRHDESLRLLWQDDDEPNTDVFLDA